MGSRDEKRNSEFGRLVESEDEIYEKGQLRFTLFDPVHGRLVRGR